MQTLVDWISVGRATTTTVNLTDYGITNGNQLQFGIRATDPAGNVGKNLKATPIVVDTTAPVPGKFTQVTVTSVKDDKAQILHTGNGLCISWGRCCCAYMHPKKCKIVNERRRTYFFALAQSIRPQVCSCKSFSEGDLSLCQEIGCIFAACLALLMPVGFRVQEQ